MQYRFGNCQFDTDKLELQRDGAPVEAQPKTLSLLKALIDNRDRLVSKDELIDLVWGGRIVSDDAISSKFKLLRKAIGDDGKEQRLVRTVYGQGFCFTSAVETGGEVAKAAPPAGESAPHGGRPSLAVLPFRLVGIAGPYAGVEEALPDEIIAALSRLRWLFIIARSSSFRMRSYSSTLEEIRQSLNVDYCLSGTVELSGNRVRLTVELADTRSGALVWDDRIDAAMEEIYEVRQELVLRIIEAIELDLPGHEAARARLKDPASLGAWEAYHLGLADLFGQTDGMFDNAMVQFERATTLDPNFARAHASKAHIHWWHAWRLLGRGGRERLEPMRTAMERALAVDPLDPFVNVTAARTRSMMGDLDGYRLHVERAIRAAPSYPYAHSLLAGVQSLSGQPEEALINNRVAMALSPLDVNFSTMCATQIISLLVLGRPDEAAYWARVAMQRPLDSATTVAGIISALHHSGDKDGAKRVADKMKKAYPDVTARSIEQFLLVMSPEARQAISDGIGPYGLGG